MGIFRPQPLAFTGLLLFLVGALRTVALHASFAPKLFFTAVVGLQLMLAALVVTLLGTPPTPVSDAAKTKGMAWWWVLAVSLGVFIWYHVASEAHISYWDSAGYWKGCIYFMIDKWGHLQHALDKTYLTMRYDEYNDLPIFLLSPFLSLTGVTLPGYTLALYLAYNLPFLAAMAWVGARLSQAQLPGRQAPPWLVAATGMLLPTTFIPAVVGMLEAIGLTLAVVIVWFTYSRAYLSRPWWHLVLFGLLIAFMGLTRRWYNIWIAGYFAAFALVTFFQLVILQRQSARAILLHFLRLGAGPLVAVIIWVSLFPQFLLRSVFNPYADLYKSYQFGSLADNILWTIQHHGWVVVAISALALLHKGGLLRLAVVLWLQLAISFYLIVRINTLAWHHHLLFSVGFCLLCFMGLYWLWQKWRPAFWLGFLLLGLNFFQVLGSASLPLPSWFMPALSHTRVPPRRRPDLENVKHLHAYLSQLPDIQKKVVYLIGSNYILNFDILKNINLPEQLDAAPWLASASEVDRRDPFPVGFPAADYVVLATPTLYHLPPEGQRVVGVLADAMRDTSLLAGSYNRLTSVELMEGVTVDVLEKVKAWPAKATTQIERIFLNAYPDYATSYQVPHTVARSFARTAPGQYGLAMMYGDTLLGLHPGQTTPAGISFGLDGLQADTAYFKPRFTGPCSNRTVATFLLDGNQTLEVELNSNDPMSYIKVPLGKARVLRIQLAAGPDQDVCDGMEWQVRLR